VSTSQLSQIMEHNGYPIVSRGIRRWEWGQRNPCREGVRQAAKALFCEEDDLLSYPDEILARPVSEYFFEFEKVCLFIDEQERLLARRYGKGRGVQKWMRLKSKERRRRQLSQR